MHHKMALKTVMLLRPLILTPGLLSERQSRLAVFANNAALWEKRVERLKKRD